MNDKEIEALDRLLDYTFADEEKDFRERRLPDHIYCAIYVLAKWRGWDLSDYAAPISIGID